MRWWRGISAGLALSGLVQPGCGGRSVDENRQPASGKSGAGGAAGRGQPGASGRSDGAAGRSAGRTNGTSGSGVGPVAGSAGRSTVTGGVGAGGAGAGGAGPGGAGSGGMDRPGGEGGGQADCDDTVQSTTGFCHGPPGLACPMALDDARQLDLYCDWDAEQLLYTECDDFAWFTYTVGGEEDYEFVYSRATGALVYGEAHVYDSACGGLSYYAGERPVLLNCSTCLHCSDAEPDSPDSCRLDDTGRVEPLPSCACTDEPCVVEPADFCPGDLPFDCPLKLDAVRADALCSVNNRDSSMLYGECPDGSAFVRWGEYEWTTLGFSRESGELVHGRAERFPEGRCEQYSATIRTEPVFDESPCTTCTLWDHCFADGAGGEAGAGAGACVVDGEGRISLPQ